MGADESKRLYIVNFSYDGEDPTFGPMEGRFSVLVPATNKEGAMAAAGDHVIDALEAGKFLGDLDKIRLYVDLLVEVDTLTKPVTIGFVEHPRNETWIVGIDSPFGDCSEVRFAGFTSDDPEADPTFFWESEPGRKLVADEEKINIKLHVSRAFSKSRAETRAARRAARKAARAR